MGESRTLDNLLDAVKYNDLESYRPSKFALKFVEFIKLVNGGKPENKTPVFHYKLIDSLVQNVNTLAVCFRGSAKALALDTLVMTPSGHVPMSDIHVGDYVIDRNGEPTVVTHESQIYTNQAYRITMSNGDSFIANEDHLHIVQRKKMNKWVEEVFSTREIVEKGVFYNHTVCERCPSGLQKKWAIPIISKPVEFEKREKFPIDPYTVGVILGDGHFSEFGKSIGVTSHIDDIEEIMSYIPYEKTKISHDKRRVSTCQFRISGIGSLYFHKVYTGTSEKKEIPYELLYGSVEERIEVLRGLMDTGGTIRTSGLQSFCSVSKALAYGVHHIVCSLGGYSSIRHYDNEYQGYYIVSFNIRNINPFKLKRKANKWIPNKKYSTGQRIMINNIEKIDYVVPTKCIKVASDTHSYLIENSIITHNTSLCEYMILYIAVFGKIDGFSDLQLGMYVSDTMENGVKNMRNNLEFRYNNSEFLRKYIPRVKFTDPEWEFVNAEGHEFSVRGFGVSTGVRGFKKYGIRPQIAWLDDLMSDKNAESKTVTNDIEQVIYKAIRQAMHPTKRRIMWEGTPFNMRDPLYKAAGSSSWYTVAFPICEKWPCTEEEFKGAWTDRFDYNFVKNEYEILKSNGRVDAFNQELMLRILSDDDRLITEEDIVWRKRSEILGKLSDCNIYITTDFATSETEKSDFSVISVWALDSDGVFNWIDGICARQNMAKNIDDLFRFVDVYHPLSTGVEISGQQKGFVNWIKREMNLRGKYFMLATDKASGEEGLRPNTSKLTRFNVALPLFKQRKISFPEELKDTRPMIECMEEILSVTAGGFKSQHDDFADTISQLPLLEYFVPNSKEEAEKEKVFQPIRSFAGSRYFTADSAYGIGSPYIV